MRVLLLAPTGRDALAIAEVIGRARITAYICQDVKELVRELENGAGAAFIAEEALTSGGVALLRPWLETQPPWSDLPFIILSSRRDEELVRAWRERLIGVLRNLTLLERPVQAVTLVSALTFALRSRERQYELREHLLERERAAANLEI